MSEIETFPALDLPLLGHAFTLRVPGAETSTADKAEALGVLHPHHLRAAESLGFPPGSLKTAEQIHGAEIAEVSSKIDLAPVPGVDGLATAIPGILLGIYVADCCAVYLADRKGRAISLLHSGKKGTELGIAPKGIALLEERFGVPPSDLVVQLSPCIRPPAYEIDFAAEIRSQCANSGVPASQIHDTGTCTSSNLARYYSYRIESGKTGRMLALLGLREP